MTKKIVKFSWVPALAATLFYSFATKEAIAERSEILSHYYVAEHSGIPGAYTFEEAQIYLAEEPTAELTPLLTNSYLAFREAIGFRESGGNYQVVNHFGYLGKYQFGLGTLALIGVSDAEEFLNSPQLQEAAFYANAARNKWILQRDIARFHNKTINGVKITESGILAAAHLSGAGNVKKFLRSGGAIGFEDGFGTSLQAYLETFAGYDTSFIAPDRYAKVGSLEEPE